MPAKKMNASQRNSLDAVYRMAKMHRMTKFVRWNFTAMLVFAYENLPDFHGAKTTSASSIY